MPQLTLATVTGHTDVQKAAQGGHCQLFALQESSYGIQWRVVLESSLVYMQSSQLADPPVDHCHRV